jgi:hypothetical protein
VSEGGTGATVIVPGNREGSCGAFSARIDQNWMLFLASRSKHFGKFRIETLKHCRVLQWLNVEQLGEVSGLRRTQSPNKSPRFV